MTEIPKRVEDIAPQFRNEAANYTIPLVPWLDPDIRIRAQSFAGTPQLQYTVETMLERIERDTEGTRLFKPWPDMSQPNLPPQYNRLADAVRRAGEEERFK